MLPFCWLVANAHTHTLFEIFLYNQKNHESINQIKNGQFFPEMFFSPKKKNQNQIVLNQKLNTQDAVELVFHTYFLSAKSIQQT